MAMRRVKVRFRPEALDDLEDIYRYVYRATANPVAAERFATRIREKSAVSAMLHWAVARATIWSRACARHPSSVRP